MDGLFAKESSGVHFQCTFPMHVSGADMITVGKEW
jgi:hypothetical protein